MPTIQIESYNLYYEVFGKGPNALLLLPGFLGTIEDDFAPVIELIDKERFTIVSWDPLGYGRSYPPAKMFCSDVYVKDANLLAKLMQGLGYRRYHIIGWSGGGQTGLILAGMFPDNVLSLTALAAGLVFEERLLWIYKAVTRVQDWPPDKLQIKLKYLDRAYIEKLCVDVYELCVKNVTEKFIYPKELFSSIRCPTLMMYFGNDNHVPPKPASFVNEFIPNAKVHIFPSGGHDYHLTNTMEVLEVWMPFLELNCE